MKIKYIPLFISLCGLMITPNIINAESFYTEPSNSLPSRVGGKSRGTSGEPIQVLVLAPDHTGLTTRERPTLYWYQSDSTTNEIEITIVDDNLIEPVLETRLKGSKETGIHPLNLEKLGIALKKDIEYRWFVAVVNDAEQRSADVITGGTIMRVDKSRLDGITALNGTAREKFTALAKAGIWYDAMDTISSEITRTGDEGLIKTRAELLSQVGLKDATK